MDTNGEPGEVTNLASGGEVFCVLESAHLLSGFTIICNQFRQARPGVNPLVVPPFSSILIQIL